MTFQYYMPTRVVSGSGCVSDHRSYLKALGKKAFIMTGGSSASRNGSLRDMTRVLDEEGIAWLHHNRVKPNPSLEEVRAASEEAKKFGADFIVAIGGGSPMDAAKAVTVLAAGNVSDEQLLGQRRFDAVLPLAVVPTTSGTGSEVTPYSILTNDKLQTKSFLNSEQVFPAVAFLDARYTLGLPHNVTTATVVDALSHAVEGFLAVRATPAPRILALESMRLIGSLLTHLAENRALDLEAREKLLYASMLAGMVIAQSGTTAVHAMGYSLTYFKGIDHGVANGMLLGRYLDYIRSERPFEVETVLKAVGQPTVAALTGLLQQLVGVLELTSEEIGKFSKIAVKAGNILNTSPRPAEEDLAALYSASCAKEG